MAKNSLSVDYALTVTLNPKLFREEPTLQYRCTHSALELHLSENKYEYVIIPELTKLNQNVHYHVILKTIITPEIKKKGVMYHIRNLFRNHKLFGHIVVKQCEDVQGWIKYMLKDLSETIIMLDLCKEYEQTKSEQIKNYFYEESEKK